MDFVKNFTNLFDSNFRFPDNHARRFLGQISALMFGPGTPIRAGQRILQEF